MGKSVGISGISVYIPRLCVRMTDFAQWRGEDPGKFTKGLGIEEISIPDYHQDPAVLAANAVRNLMQTYDLKPSKIGRIALGSESGSDLSMPHTYPVAEMLEMVYGEDSFADCWVDGEKKAACAGAFEELLSTIDWIRAGENNGQVGIVVATDDAKYDLGSSGEATQGAGAVAVLVEENPQALAFDEGLRGFGFRRTKDFFKPKGKSPIDTPVVYGGFSKRVYMRDMKRAVTNYGAKAVARGLIKLNGDDCPSDHIPRFVMHIPYPGMPRDALVAYYRHERRGTDFWKKEMIPQVNGEPQASDFGITKADIVRFETLDGEPKLQDFKTPQEFETAMKVWKYFEADGEHIKKIRKTPQFGRFFDSHMRSSLEVSSHTGNWYTASVFLGLASLLERDKQDLTDMRVGMGSFGSSSIAIATSAVVQPGYKEIARRIGTEEKLRPENRRPLTLEEYERLHGSESWKPVGKKGSVIEPVQGEFELLGLEPDGWRVYAIA